jgi:uncharacterized membrane protein
VLDALDRRPPAVSEHQLALYAERHSGPLPPARQLGDYNDVLPGLADRIVRMAELEQQHRHMIEEAEVAQPYVLARRGQTFGLLAMVVFLAFAGGLALRGEALLAAILGGIDLVAIIALFLTGQRDDEEVVEEEDSDDEAPPPA